MPRQPSSAAIEAAGSGVQWKRAARLAYADVTTIGWNLRTGERRVRPLKRDDAVATLKYLAAFADTMQGTTEFEATPSTACTFCDWRSRCPEAATIVEDSDLVLEADLEPVSE